jgi:YlmC/YmxH family sporulation protein
VRFSELASKEIISLTDGSRLGPIGEADLVFDELSGRLQTILVPPKSRFSRTGQYTEVPWTCVRRVGPEVVIIDLDDLHPKRRL